MKKDKPKRACIGIDIGGTKSLYALFDESFEVLAEEKLRTHSDRGGVRAFWKGMSKAVRQLRAEAGRLGYEVKHVGVGCAGHIDMKAGKVHRSPNIRFLKDFPLRSRLEKLTRAKVFVVNDVQAGLYGELQLGAARKGRHVIGVFIGTGVGGALAIAGRLHLGTTGRAGDIGNYILHSHDLPVDPHRKEVLDAVASRTAIAGDAAALAAKFSAPALRRAAGTDVREIKARHLAEAIGKGDKAIERLVRSRANMIGTALSNLVDFLNPDTVVLGGGLVEELPGLVRGEVEKSIEAHSSPRAAKAVKVRVAKLGRYAGAAGAAKLAIDMHRGRPPIDLAGR